MTVFRCSGVPWMPYDPDMEKIPPPPEVRQVTPWKEYADGCWRRAIRDTDFRGRPDSWARAGRAWAGRNSCDATFLIDGDQVRFVLQPQEAAVLPDPAAGPDRAGSAGDGNGSAAARAAWAACSAAFLGPQADAAVTPS